MHAHKKRKEKAQGVGWGDQWSCFVGRVLGCGLFSYKTVMMRITLLNFDPSFLLCCPPPGVQDSPINKLLYARDIPRYKQMVERYGGGRGSGEAWGVCAAEALGKPWLDQGSGLCLFSICCPWLSGRYYTDIRQTVPASDQEMNSVLAELSRVSLPFIRFHLLPLYLCDLAGRGHTSCRHTDRMFQCYCQRPDLQHLSEQGSRRESCHLSDLARYLCGCSPG